MDMKQFTIILFLLFCRSMSDAQTPDKEWPVFRGKSDLSGITGSEFPASPALLWNLATGSHSKSSPVVSGEFVYFGDDKGTLYAAATNGTIKWKYEAGSPIEAPP